MSSKFITSKYSSILLSMCAAILSMVFDEDDFPHLTINLEIFFLFQCFQLTSRSECLAEGVTLIPLQVFRARLIFQLGIFVIK